MKWPLIFLISLNLSAATYQAQNVKEQPLSHHANIVLGSIWQNLGWPMDESPKFEPSPKPPGPTPKKLSRGESKVQEMLQKNREKLKKRSAETKEDSGLSLKEQYLKNLDRLKTKNQDTLSNWKSQREKTLKLWKEKQKEFLNQLADFKEATFTFESSSIPVGPSKLKAPIVTPVKDKFYVIPGALDVKIKNQGKRPTCAAFAGIRAIETLLAAHEEWLDLSEQYLYWSAKPECKQSPCSKRGSWVAKPYEFSKKLTEADIPLENSCPYSRIDRPSNQTHIPLGMGCQQGKVKIDSFLRIETTEEIYTALKNNQPVIAGFKLSPNFYENNGLITYTNSKSSAEMDEHSKGHALLLVGFIKLPPALVQRDEGKLCFLAANSWGEGWGQGGYSCLTESWVRHHRIKNAFMALKSAKIN